MIVKINGINGLTQNVELIATLEVTLREIMPDKVDEICKNIYSILFWDRWLGSKPSGLTLYSNPRHYTKDSIFIVDENSFSYSYDIEKCIWFINPR